MSIMVAGGLTFAIPGALPQATAAPATDGTLTVSSTEFGGTQIIEIKLKDPEIDSTDATQNQPEVEISGEPVRMVQTTSGDWYAYVAEASFGAGPIANTGTIPAGTAFTGGSGTAYTVDNNILKAKAMVPNAGSITTNANTPAWPFVQVYVAVDEGSTDVTYDGNAVTVTYDNDLSESASVAFDRSGAPAGAAVHLTITDPRLNLNPTDEDIWTLIVNPDVDTNYPAYGDTILTAQLGSGHGVLTFDSDDLIVAQAEDDTTPDVYEITFEETGDNTGEFTAVDVDDDTDPDNDDVPAVTLNEDAQENAPVDISYAGNSAQMVVRVGSFSISITADDVWSSGEEATVTLTNPDINLNTEEDENIEINAEFVPTIEIGDPITIDEFTYDDDTTVSTNDLGVANVNTDDETGTLNVDSGNNGTSTYGLRQTTYVGDGTAAVSNSTASTVDAVPESKLLRFNTDIPATNTDDAMVFNVPSVDDSAPFYRVHASSSNDGVTFTLKNNVTTFEGVSLEPGETKTLAKTDITDGMTLEVTSPTDGLAKDTVIGFDILSFGDIDDGIANNAIYRHLLEETDDGGVFTGALEYVMLNQVNVEQDSTYDEVETEGDSLTMIIDDSYTGNELQVIYHGQTYSVDVLTNTGTVSLDSDRYSTNGEAVLTLEDADLNTDNTSIDRYVLNENGTVRDSGSEGVILEFTINNLAWSNHCDPDTTDDVTYGLPDAFELAETAAGSGIFTASFDIPETYCDGSDADPDTSGNDRKGDGSVTGKSIKVVYHDFREAGGAEIKVSDSATVQAVTGTISLDRKAYPIPADDKDGNVVVHIEINDPDHNTDSAVLNTIDTANVNIEIRSVDSSTPIDIDKSEYLNTVDLKDVVSGESNLHSTFTETSEDSGVFKETIEISSDILGDGTRIAQGYVLSVEYTDESDATGEEAKVTASATFNLGGASLSTDKTEYTINEKAFITLVDHDSNYDSETRETIDLIEITWEGNEETKLNSDDTMFDTSPSYLRETEENSGIFLVEISIPKYIDSPSDTVERGERVTLTYEDISPAGNDYPDPKASSDVETSFTISRTGASLTLDKDVYSWRDRVTVTVVAPDANIDSLLVESITIDANSQEGKLNDQSLSETGSNTGIFQGTIDLGGVDNDDPKVTCTTKDGTLCVGSEDGFSVAYTYDEDERDLIQSALVRWNVGEVAWSENSYREGTSGTLQVVDPDMNLYPDTPDNIRTVVFSDTYRGGISVTLTETEVDSGVFEGEVLFDVLRSEGTRLQVTEGDIVTASYTDKTLPNDDDSTRITGTTTIGSIVPPLERVAVSNLGVVDALNNAVDSVSVGQQVNIAADLTSAQSRSQDYAYLLQIQNMDGVTVHLSWAASSLAGFGGANVSQSWTPDETGSYTATVFVWESLTNPTALSPQNSIDITVV